MSARRSVLSRVLSGRDINDASALGGDARVPGSGVCRTMRCDGTERIARSARRVARSIDAHDPIYQDVFPERYGKELVRVAVDLLSRRAVPPAVYIKHHLDYAGDGGSFFIPTIR